MIRHTKAHGMGQEMAFAAEPLVISYKWTPFLGEGTARALLSVGAPLWGASPTHGVHGETGSTPIQGAAKLLQLVVNPITFPGSGHIGGLSTQARVGGRQLMADRAMWGTLSL